MISIIGWGVLVLLFIAVIADMIDEVKYREQINREIDKYNKYRSE